MYLSFDITDVGRYFYLELHLIGNLNIIINAVPRSYFKIFSKIKI